MTRRKAAASAVLSALPVKAANGTALPLPAGHDDDDGTFPDDDPPSGPPELAPALVVAPRVDNAERVARQRDAFADIEAAPEALPAPAKAAGKVPAKAATPRAAPRRITAELVRAETALDALERRRERSLRHHEMVWAEKRVTLIRSFAPDVLAALEAMNVLEGDELEALGLGGED